MSNRDIVAERQPTTKRGIAGEGFDLDVLIVDV